MTDVGRHFEEQAEACLEMGSPFTARLATLHARYLDRQTAVGRRVLDWAGNPRADALSLRLFGGLHRLVLDRTSEGLRAIYPPREAGDDQLAGAVRQAFEEHEGALLAYLDSPPQTNEVGRSGMLLPGFLLLAREIGRPLDILELGASAGVNGLWDAYAYRYGGATWSMQDAPLRYGGAWWGSPDAPLTLDIDAETPPPLGGEVRVARYRACDRSPLYPARAEDRQRLLSYVWADQAARLSRLAAALDALAARGLRVEQRDAADFVETCLAEAPLAGTLRVVVHTIVWQYLPAATKTRIEAAMARAASAAPVAWLRLESDGAEPGAGLHLATFLDGPSLRRDRLLARADYHGRWLRWLA